MSVLLDEETVVLEGLDFEVPCRMGAHAAEVFVTCRFCEKNHVALCSEHLTMKRLEADERIQAAYWTAISCLRCQTMARSFDDLFRVVPL